MMGRVTEYWGTEADSLLPYWCTTIPQDLLSPPPRFIERVHGASGRPERGSVGRVTRREAFQRPSGMRGRAAQCDTGPLSEEIPVA